MIIIFLNVFRKLAIIGRLSLRWCPQQNTDVHPPLFRMCHLLQSLIWQPINSLTKEPSWLSQQGTLRSCQRQQTWLPYLSSSHFSFPGSLSWGEALLHQTCLQQSGHHSVGWFCISTCFAVENTESEPPPSRVPSSPQPPQVPQTAFYLSGLQLPLILVPFILQLFHFDFEVLELLQ